jgi:hypothetical protein
MRTKITAGVVIAGVASYWAASTYGQVQSVPGPGSGVVMVQGEVDIRRLPAIDVQQWLNLSVARAIEEAP